MIKEDVEQENQQATIHYLNQTFIFEYSSPSKEKNPYTEFQDTDNQDTENPYADSQDTNNTNSNNTNSNNTNSNKKNLSINESIQQLDVSLAIQKGLLKEIDRLMLHKSSLEDIEVAYKDFVINRGLTDASFLKVLHTVLQVENIYNFWNYFNKALEQYIENGRAKQQGASTKNQRQDKLPQWMSEDEPQKKEDENWLQKKKELEKRINKYKKVD